jgi:aspartyl-tRNA(Asn)/glutamyl-tRNA(Gln) amidotransferase subunit C
MDVKHVAALANLPLDPKTEKKLQAQFEETLKTVAKINELDTSGVEPTSQVTGLANVTREDVIDLSRVLTQDQAIGQAPKTHHGYIVVPAIFDD